MTFAASLFDLVTGKPLPIEDDGPATRTRIMVGALLASAVFAAIYGLAAGSSSMSLMMQDVYKIPMVLILSALAAVPAMLLTWKLLGATHRSSDLLMGHVAGNFTASLVLATAAPIVALYYHSSTWLGGVLGMSAAIVAVFIGFFTGIRAIHKRVPSGVSVFSVAAPVTVMIAMQLLVLVQLIHVASPILPEVTVFDGGMDAIVGN